MVGQNRDTTSTITGLAVTDNEDGTFTITKDGTASSQVFAKWLATQGEEVHKLCRDLVEGRRGKAYPGEEAPYRPVTVNSIRFRPETLVAARVWIGPHDGGSPQLNSDWS